MYPILETNIQAFITTFNKLKLINIQQLTKLPQEATLLTPEKWIEAQKKIH